MIKTKSGTKKKQDKSRETDEKVYGERKTDKKQIGGREKQIEGETSRLCRSESLTSGDRSIGHFAQVDEERQS